mmetsp:Transcript_53778/g.105179  ORF Transcript_53778/g.105179 Transcript_53778/m.105179 type:complete len:241 (+) Transcript_53778:802-1524(+)
MSPADQSAEHAGGNHVQVGERGLDACAVCRPSQCLHFLCEFFLQLFSLPVSVVCEKALEDLGSLEKEVVCRVCLHVPRPHQQLEGLGLAVTLCDFRDRSQQLHDAVHVACVAQIHQSNIPCSRERFQFLPCLCNPVPLEFLVQFNLELRKTLFGLLHRRQINSKMQQMFLQFRVLHHVVLCVRVHVCALGVDRPQLHCERKTASRVIEVQHRSSLSPPLTARIIHPPLLPSTADKTVREV